MSVISTDQQVVPVINVFTTEPEHQERLVQILVDATESVIRHMPGFVSANVHSSLDGTSVVNYAQWRSVEDFRAMHSHPDAQEHFHEVRAIAKPQMNLCRLTWVEEARTGSQ